MDPAYAAGYRDLYERHWWWRAREELIVDVLERHAPAGGYGPILDVGCGDGLLFPVLRRFGEPRGVEADATLVASNDERIHVGEFDASFDPGERFGLVLMLDVIEHLDDDVAALSHAARLLAPGGLVVVTVPALRALWTAHDEFNHHRRRYTRGGLARVASRAGLELVAGRYFFHWLVPAKLLVRFKEWLSPLPPEPATVPAAPVNRLCRGLCRLERATWGRLPWPWGSSVLMVLAPKTLSP